MVDAVVDGEHGGTGETHAGNAAVGLRKPEGAGSGIDMMDAGVFDPDGGTAGRLGFDPGDSNVLRVDPDAAAKPQIRGDAGAAWRTQQGRSPTFCMPRSVKV